MDATEAAALKQLGGRESWGIDELPPSVDLDVLRGLDDEGLIEARYVIMRNRQQYPGDPTPPAPSPSEWFSPLRFPLRGGGWSVLVRRNARDFWSHPAEVRVSEKGRAALARATRVETSPKKRKKRKPSGIPRTRSMTQLELNTLRVVSKHGGNIAAAAAELGKDPSTVRENYRRALKKSEQFNGRKSRSASTRGPMPTDRRGNCNAPDPRDDGDGD